MKSLVMQTRRQILGFTFFLALSSAFAHAAVPSRIVYQGRLSKSGVGAAGRHTITVQFVDASGTNLSQSQTFDVDVPTSGDFSLEIDHIPPDADWINGLPKMRVIVGGETLTPDQAFSAAPYALVARNVENLNADKVKLSGTEKLLSSWQSAINPAGIDANVIIGTISVTANHGKNHAFNGTDSIPTEGLFPSQISGVALVLNSSTTQTIESSKPVVPLIVKGYPSLSVIEVMDNDAVPTKRFHIQGSGNAFFDGKVGIGTETPLEKLDVLGANIILGSSSDLGGNNYGSVKFRTPSGNVSFRSFLSGLFGITGNRSGLALDLQNDDTSAFEIVREAVGPVFGVRASGQVYVGGNMGIGTANPTAKLEVSGGDVKINGLISASSMELTGRYKDKTGDIMPVGTVLPFAGATIPPGWLICDGTIFVISAHPELNDLRLVLGSIYGGDGASTFGVPDLRRRVPVGSGGTGTPTLGNSLGAKGGEETHTLTIAEIPPHHHSYTRNKTEASFSGSNALALYQTNEENTGDTGGGLPHNNIQPSLILNYIIKY
jgi:microcystin-dependent protein